MLEFDPIDCEDQPLVISGPSQSIILEFPSEPESLPVYGPGRSEQAGFILFDVE